MEIYPGCLGCIFCIGVQVTGIFGLADAGSRAGTGICRNTDHGFLFQETKKNGSLRGILPDWNGCQPSEVHFTIQNEHRKQLYQLYALLANLQIRCTQQTGYYQPKTRINMHIMWRLCSIVRGFSDSVSLSGIIEDFEPTCISVYYHQSAYFMPRNGQTLVLQAADGKSTAHAVQAEPQ